MAHAPMERKIPERARMTGSKASSAAIAPSELAKPGIETWISAGLILWHEAASTPRRSATPGRKPMRRTCATEIS